MSDRDRLVERIARVLMHPELNDMDDTLETDVTVHCRAGESSQEAAIRLLAEAALNGVYSSDAESRACERVRALEPVVAAALLAKNALCGPGWHCGMDAGHGRVCPQRVAAQALSDALTAYEKHEQEES